MLSSTWKKNLFISGCLHVALNCKGMNTIFIYLVLFFNNVQKENVWPMTHVYMYLKPKHKSPWFIKPRKKMIKFLWSFLFIDFKDWGLKKIQNLLLILFVKTHVSTSTQIYTLKILKGRILIFCKGTEAIRWRSWIMVLCWCLIDLIMKISSMNGDLNAWNKLFIITYWLIYTCIFISHIN